MTANDQRMTTRERLVEPVLRALTSNVGLIVVGGLAVWLILSWEFLANELFRDELRMQSIVNTVAPRSLYAPRDFQVKLPSGQEVKVLARELIVMRGERISADQAAKIEAMVAGGLSVNLAHLWGNLVLTLLLTTVLLVHTFHMEDRDERPNTPLLVSVMVGVLGMAKLALGNITDIDLMFLINPVPVAVILTTIFISTEQAIVAAIVLSILIGVLGYHPSAPASAVAQFQLAAYALMGGIVGVFSCSRKQSGRSDILRAGMAMGITNAVVILGFNLIFQLSYQPASFLAVFERTWYGLFNGVGCAMLVLGMLPFLEDTFHVTTSTRLLELINPRNPLLQKIITEAPGTFHHSQNVGHLAEKAAEEIGADPNLAKCAAYYHDLGKTKRPYYFIENQMGGVNYHDNLSPQMSKLIIHSHTKDGVEMARKYGLPKVITDAMVEHHGNDLVAFFYHRARQAETEDDEVQEQSFRYPGPKPQSKETAIIMLADAVEAAGRTLRKPTPQSIENLVSKIINDKFVDGQFDECELTKKDCEAIAGSFSRTLMAMYHSRIQYPTDLAAQAKGPLAPAIGNGDPSRTTPAHGSPVAPAEAPGGGDGAAGRS
jgi:putative nucleotidyltransferase with HDIG domain